MENSNQDQVATTLAVNTGNMIASLNMQIAKLQVSHKELEETINRLTEENDKLIKIVKAQQSKDNPIIKINKKQKGGNANESLNHNTNNK